jgi:hypothetical protein
MRDDKVVEKLQISLTADFIQLYRKHFKQDFERITSNRTFPPNEILKCQTKRSKGFNKDGVIKNLFYKYSETPILIRF